MEFRHSYRPIVLFSILTALFYLLLFRPLIADLASLMTAANGSQYMQLIMSFVFFGTCALAFTQELLKISSECLTLDDDSVNVRIGILSRQTSDIPYHHIASIAIRQTLAQRMMGIGNIVISVGNESSRIKFGTLENAAFVKQTIQSRIPRYESWQSRR